MKTLSRDYGSPVNPLATVDGGLGGSAGTAATQAALAAALEACVIRLTESEAWVKELDMEVRQLRTTVEKSNKAITVLGSQLGEIHERSSDASSPARSGPRSPPSMSIPGIGSTMAQCIARLDGDVRHLRLKLDASDEELEQLKINRANLVTKHEVIEMVDMLRLQFTHFEDKSDRNAINFMETLQDMERFRTGAATKQDVHEMTEPTRRELRRLSDQMEHGKGIPKDGDDACMNSDQFVQAFRGDQAKAMAELRHTTQTIKQELIALTDRVAAGEENLSKVAQGTTRHDLLEATKLLSEVRDASKIFRKDIASTNEPVLTRREYSNSTELWRRELASMAVQVSQTLAREPALEIEAAVEGQSNVTRQELNEVAHLLGQEIEKLAGRVNHAGISWSKEKDEFWSLPSGDNAGIRSVQPQGLTDALGTMKSELQLVVDRVQALDRIQQDMTQQLQPLVAHALEALWREHFGVTLRQELVKEFDHEHATARRDRERIEERIHGLEDRIQLRSSNELSRLSDSMRREFSDINQRIGRLEFGRANEPENITTRERLVSIGDRLTMVEVAVGIVSATGPDSTGLAKRLEEIGDTLGGSSSRGNIPFANESRSTSDNIPSFTLSRASFSPEADRDLAHVLVDVRRDHHQWHNIIESLLARFNGFNERITNVEGVANVVSRLHVAENDGVNTQNAVSKQVPLLPLDALKSSHGMQHLEKIVEDLRKRIDELRDSKHQSSATTPRSASVGGEGMAQLMAAVKRDQESERRVVATLLERIGSLVDRVVVVEQKVATAVEGATLSTSQSDYVSDSVSERIDQAVKDRCQAFAMRLDAVEGVMPGLKELTRPPRLVSVADYLGKDFEFN